MRWRVFTVAAAMSLLISVAALILCPLGCWRRLNLNYDFGQSQVNFQTQGGTLAIGRYQYPVNVSRHGWSWYVRPIDPDVTGGVLDFGHLHMPRRVAMGIIYDAAWCPGWFIATLFGFLPALWLIRYRKRRERLMRGRCQKCGYDLRATPDRCPECGTAPAVEPRVIA